VVEVRGAPVLEHVGVAFYFCGEQCFGLFREAPHKFAGEPEA
jgi:YHS domain-containing protein